MMGRLSLSLKTFIFLLLICGSLSAQSKLVFHIIGGYSQPMGDLKGEITQPDTSNTDIASYPFQVKLGFNFGADGKIAFGRTRNIRLVFGLNYSVFNNSADIPNVYFPGQTVTFRPKVNVLSFSAGGEYSFLPKKLVQPFVGFDLTMNFWSGSFSWDNSGDTAFYGILGMKSATRIGVQFGGGVDLKLGTQEGLVVGFKYNMANLLGKSQYDATQVESGQVSLGDKASGIYPAKNLSYLQIYVGISMFLGPPPKKIR